MRWKVNTVYTFESRIRYSEVGEDRLLTVPSLIDYFQDCSTFQSEDLGMGLDHLKAEKMAWFVLFWQLNIYRRPKLAEKVRTGPSPYAMKGFLGYRNFMMETLEGERLVEANSVWSLMNTETMRPCRIPAPMMELYGTNPPFPMEYRDRKISLIKPDGAESAEGSVITVSEQHLDSNHHVNNGQYVRFVMNMIPAGAELANLYVEYRKQARLGDRLVPVCFRKDGNGGTAYVVSLENEADRREIFAAAEMVIKA